MLQRLLKLTERLPSRGTGHPALDIVRPADGERNWTVTRVLIRKMIYADRKVVAAVRQIRNEIVRMTKSMDRK